MIKRLLLYFLREEIADRDTMFFNALQNARDTDRAWIVKSLALSFSDINQKINSLKSELLVMKTTSTDNLGDITTALRELAEAVDLQSGALAALEDKVAVLNEMNDGELDDLEERIKNLEERK